MDLHALEDVLVADGRPDDAAARGGQGGFEPAVGEHGHDEDALGERASLEPIERAQAEQLVAVDDLAPAVHRRRGGRRRRRARSRGRRRGARPPPRARPGAVAPHADVDVDAVGLVVDDLHRRPRRGQDLRRGDASAAVGAVEHDPEVAARPAGEVQAVLAVAVEEAGARRRPDRSRRCAARRARRPARSAAPAGPPRASSSLRPAPSSTLRPLSSAGLWDAETMIAAGEAVAAGEEGEGRRRQDAGEVHVGAQARGPGRDRRDEHVARPAGVLAQHDRAAGAGHLVGDGPPQGERERRPEVDVGDAPDPVRAEEAAHGAIVGDGLAGSTRRRERAWASAARGSGVGCGVTVTDTSWGDTATRVEVRWQADRDAHDGGCPGRGRRR